MKITSNGMTIELTLDEAIALAMLLGGMSAHNMMKYSDIDAEQAYLLQCLYGTLSAFVPLNDVEA